MYMSKSKKKERSLFRSFRRDVLECCAGEKPVADLSALERRRGTSRLDEGLRDDWRDDVLPEFNPLRLDFD